MDHKQIQKGLQLLSLLGLTGCGVLVAAGWQQGLFRSPEAMSSFIAGLGTAGLIAFIAFQAVQVVVPILPGSLGCLAGVLMYGAGKGFLYNYIGICLGSLMAFGIAKLCGRPLLEKLFSEKLMQRYDHWTDADSPFTRLFALAIFLPVAPDDFLCYLAGTTRMRWSVFTLIILLGKPAAIALYSLGLQLVWEQALRLIG